MMLVKKIIKSTVFCGIGILVGKTVSEQKHKNTVKKILSADYMDDHTKIKLLQDLNDIKVNNLNFPLAKVGLYLENSIV